MIVSPYGDGRLDPQHLAESAGFFLASMLANCRDDPRNRGLRTFGQWLAYRHELRQMVDGEPVDRWQAPYETAEMRIGDCEDMTVYWCMYPTVPGEYLPAIYEAGPNLVHAVVCDLSRKHVWQAEPSARLYVDGIGYVRRGTAGLIDPSWMTGMPHPYGPRLKGHSYLFPRYFAGANRCTPATDLRDRMAAMEWRN